MPMNANTGSVLPRCANNILSATRPNVRAVTRRPEFLEFQESYTPSQSCAEILITAFRYKLLKITFSRWITSGLSRIKARMSYRSTTSNSQPVIEPIEKLRCDPDKHSVNPYTLCVLDFSIAKQFSTRNDDILWISPRR